jgi:hypothetical protein
MIPAIVARLTSKGLISAVLVAVTAVAALASCGSPSEDGEAGVGFTGCGPEGVAHHLGGFLNAVSARQDERVLRYIAPHGEFMKFTLYDWVSPGGGRDDSHSPRELHDSFVAAIPKNHVAELLAVEVGRPGPFAAEYEQQAGPQETAGVQVAARIGEDRFLAGKFGVECEAGRIYAGAMNLRHRREARTACGRAIGAGAEPAFCRVD